MKTKVAVALFVHSPVDGISPVLRKKTEHDFSLPFCSAERQVEDGMPSAHLASDLEAIRTLVGTILNVRTIRKVFDEPKRMVNVYERVDEGCFIRYYGLLVDLLDISSLEERLAAPDFFLTLVPYGTVVSTDPNAAYRMSFHSCTAVILGYRQFDSIGKEKYPLPVQPELVTYA